MILRDPSGCESGRSTWSLRVAAGLGCCIVAALLVLTGACSEGRPKASGGPRSASVPEGPEPDVQAQFQEAALRGRVDEVRELLVAGVEIDSTNRSGTTPLMASAIGGHVEIARLLLESGADFNATRSDGSSALFLALDRPDKRGRVDIANVLLDSGADVSSGEGAGSFLIKAVRARKWELAGRLVELGVPAPALANRERLQKAVAEQDLELLRALLDPGVGSGPAAPLCLAIYRKDAELLGELLGHGLEDERCEKSLPLIAAAEGGELSALEALLEYEPEVNRLGKNGRTALMAAARFNQLDVARTLIANGAGVDLQGFSPAGKPWKGVEGSPLIEAVRGRHSEMVELLLAAGADANLADERGSTALKVATVESLNSMVTRLMAAGASYEGASSDNLQNLLIHNACNGDLVEHLLAGGADPALPDERGTPPLVAVAKCLSGRESVRKLLDAGADVNDPDATGRTPLIAAAGRGSQETAQQLLQRGADLEAIDDRGWTALTVSAASANTNAGTTQVLLDHGANVDHRDGDGATPLMRAAAGSRVRQIKTLVEGGARLGLRDSSGHTAAVYLRDFIGPRPRERVLETADGTLRVTDHWFDGCWTEKQVESDLKLADCERTEQWASIQLTIYQVPPEVDPPAFLRSLHSEARLFELARPEGTSSFVAARMPGGLNRHAVAISTIVALGSRKYQLEIDSPEDEVTLRGWILAGFAESLERENG